MKQYALIILTDHITVREFEYKDDFDLARQTLVGKDIKFIPLKWHSGADIWMQPEVVS